MNYSLTAVKAGIFKSEIEKAPVLPCLTLVPLLVAFSVFAQTNVNPLSERIANYRITCEFEPGQNLIHGTEKLEWLNTSSDSLDELQFHLYMNAFKHANTTFLRELGQIDQMLEAGNWGHCTVKRLQIDGGADLTGRMIYIQPDDGNELDETVMAVGLPEKLAPGQSIKLDIEFETRLPALTERAGVLGDFILVAQWFPKIGVYEAAGWNCHQYHANSEFYADFGTYDVTIILPAKYKVGATGVQIEQSSRADSRQQLRFRAEDVHDFAWAADPGFVEFRDRIEQTELRLLIQRRHKSLANRILNAVKSGYRYYSDAFGEYPYPALTVVDSPLFNAVMEYPMFFLTGNFDGIHLVLPSPIPVAKDNHFPERLTLHELAHMWWYGISANNEFEEAWLDEGITEFSTTKAVEALYGDVLLTPPDGRLLRIRDFAKSQFLKAPAVTIKQNAWDFSSWTEYYSGSYVKPKLMLLTLDNSYPEQWPRVMRAFFQRWQFRHPKTGDFIDLAAEIIGDDLKPFLIQYLTTNATLDYRIRRVKNNEVILEKIGDLVYPVNLRFEFSEGDVTEKRWSGKEPQTSYQFDSQLEAVIIDPQNHIEFELDKNNNRWLRN